MKTIRLAVMLPALLIGLLSHSRAFADSTNSIPSELRKGTFSCDAKTLQTALDLKHAGWTYVMPEPKSPQAAWGHRDGRTTWWVGYWINKDKTNSSIQPKKDTNG